MAIVAMTHRNGVSSMPAMRLLPRPSPYATGCHGIRPWPLKSHVYAARQSPMPARLAPPGRGEPDEKKQIVPQGNMGGGVCEAAEGPTARPPSRNPQAVRACLCPAIHECER